MAGRVEGKVAFITGAARGQGRSHAVRLAQEGADIIAIDICRGFDALAGARRDARGPRRDRRHGQEPRPPHRHRRGRRPRLRRAEGGGRQRRRTTRQARHRRRQRRHRHHRRQAAQDDARTSGTRRSTSTSGGVWKTVKAGVPHLLAGGRGGSVIITSSVGGIKAYPQVGHYVAAKHGVVGLMRTFAVELGQHSIRVNTVHPTHVCTPAADERGDLPTVPARPGESRARRPRADLPVVPLPSDPVGGARRHQQCGAVPGLRRSPLHHRRHPSRRRRQPSEIGECAA